jgi:hypothetical protein
MLEHARNLEFEKAARVRDQLALLREQAFGAAARQQRGAADRPGGHDRAGRLPAWAAVLPPAARADGLHGQHLPLAHGRRRVARQAAGRGPG